MEDFSYCWPTKILFGKGTENNVGKEINGKKVLLHYGGGSIKKSGLYDRVVTSLKESGIEYVELSGVVPNPRLDKVKEGIELCRKENIDFILAVGGGSVIDSAKAIAAGAPYDGDVWDFFKGTEIKKTLPIGTILTISAAGSEASDATVISNGNRKLAAVSELLRPRFSILNPELTSTLPKFQVACGIADMFAHIVERYFTNTPSVDLTDKLCEATFRCIVKNAKTLVNDPADYDSAAEIMWASTVAHQGILSPGREEDWASHLIEHEVSAFYDITHGAGLAVIIPAWMRYVYKHDVARFAQFAKEVWGVGASNDEEAALKGIEQTKSFFKELDLPTTLKELEIDNAKFEEMAKACAEKSVGCFVKLSSEDIVKIYELALE
jgi:hypothetical protein